MTLAKLVIATMFFIIICSCGPTQQKIETEKQKVKELAADDSALLFSLTDRLLKWSEKKRPRGFSPSN